jgi:hypothetical protein
MRPAYLVFAGAGFAILWIAEIIRGAAIEHGQRVHLTAALISAALTPLFWFGGSALASAAGRDLRPIAEIAALALAAAAALLALIELARWLSGEEAEEA